MEAQRQAGMLSAGNPNWATNGVNETPLDKPITLSRLVVAADHADFAEDAERQKLAVLIDFPRTPRETRHARRND
jgi:hypothetical protein